MLRWLSLTVVGLVWATSADAFEVPSAPSSSRPHLSRQAIEQAPADSSDIARTDIEEKRHKPIQGSLHMSARDYGAVCDGKSHPLSSVYRTLADAQDSFPDAASLSEELDGAAISRALVARSSSGGGNVEIPSGTCLLSKGILLPGGASHSVVRLVGQGRSSILQPAAPMGALLTIPVGSVDVETLALQNAGDFASAGIDIKKPIDNSPIRIRGTRIQGFPLAIYLNGDNIDIDSNYFLLNKKVLIANKCLNVRIRSNYQLGGDGLDFPVGQQQCEGVSVAQNILLPGGSGTFALRVKSGLQFDFTDNIFDQVTSGPGVILDGTNAAVNHVTFKGGWVGAQGKAKAQTDGIQILGGARNVILNGLTLTGWRGYDISVQAASHLAMTDIRARSERSLASANLDSSNATTITGGVFSSPNAAVIESGSTSTRATGAYFASPPKINPGSQYINNFGDTQRELELAGQRGGTRLAVAGGMGNMQISSAGAAPDIATTFASKGAAPVQIAPGGSNGVAVFRQGSVGLLRPVLDQSKVRVTATGGALDVPATTSWYAMIQSSAVPSLTLKLPVPAGDGHFLRISTVGQITSLTLAPQSGDTVRWKAGGPLSGDSGIALAYDAASRTWLRVN